MALYEENYFKIRELAPSLDNISRLAVSRVFAHLPLQLTVLERFRYTTTLRLTYLFRESGLPRTDPDIVVRLYHDAHLAEVQGFGDTEAPSAASPGMPADGWVLERKWHLNRFLEKWLAYCIGAGHRFPLRAG